MDKFDIQHQLNKFREAIWDKEKELEKSLLSTIIKQRKDKAILLIHYHISEIDAEIENLFK